MTCPHCAEESPETAIRCPHCGELVDGGGVTGPAKRNSRVVGLLMFLGALFGFVAGLVLSLSGCELDFEDQGVAPLVIFYAGVLSLVGAVFGLAIGLMVKGR